MLYVSAKNGHDNVAQFLVDNGADVNSTNKGGVRCILKFFGSLFFTYRSLFGKILLQLTPLYAAALGGHNEIGNYLIEKGSDLNFKNKDKVSRRKPENVNLDTSITECY